MIEYRPWSQLELYNSYVKYQKGIFSILDIEASGQCNYNCMYCDSPNRTKKCTINIYDIEKMFSSFLFSWVFICGLGEPTIGSNYDFLVDILKLCKKYNVKCSIFSNGSIYSKEVVDFIEAGILHILFKYDSFDYKLNANLYGTSDVQAKEQCQNIKRYMKYAQCKDNMTNIGVSIVPTRLNVDAIPKIVEECCENQVFPLIADLENSGRGQEHFLELSLSLKELQSVKEKVENIIGEKYHIPICPAVISGIHISNNGEVVVDEVSGLACPWFWLEEPRLYRVLRLTPEITLDEIMQKIMGFRNKRLNEVEEILRSSVMEKNKKFGGCGGDIGLLLETYIRIQHSLKRGVLGEGYLFR